MQSQDQFNETENHFLEPLRTELSLAPTEAAPMVASVLQAMRQTLSRQNAESMVNRLPEFLRKHFSTSGKEEKEVTVEHLDELVTLVMERDKSNGKVIFHSEIQTLHVVLYTLRKIFKCVDPGNCPGISTPLYQEFRQAATGLA